MITESDMLEIRLQMEALICKREAMILNNTQHHTTGHTVMDYSPDDFCGLAKQFDELRRTLINLIEG